MTDHNYSNDETIDLVISEVLKRMKIVQKPSITWQQMVYSFDGKITKTETVNEANRLLNSILVEEFGSIDGYEKFLVNQQKMYEDYVKQVDKNQQKYIPSPVVKISTPLPQTEKTKNSPVTQDVKPSSVVGKIGDKRRGKTLEEISKEAGYESVESYLFWNRNNR